MARLSPRSLSADALRHLPVLPPGRLQRGALVDLGDVRPLRGAAASAGASAARHGPGERLDEVLELAGGPALERLAVALVGGDDAVAVVPVQARLRVEPERAPGPRSHAGEDVRPRVAPVRARVAEHD